MVKSGEPEPALVVLGRLLWRFVSPPPAAPANHGRATRLASKAGHAFLYLALFVLMLSSYLISTADGHFLCRKTRDIAAGRDGNTFWHDVE